METGCLVRYTLRGPSTGSNQRRIRDGVVPDVVADDDDDDDEDDDGVVVVSAVGR